MNLITWNPNDIGSGLSLSNDNFTVTSSVSTWRSVRATKGKSEGKWYWEITLDDIVGSGAVKRNVTGIGTSESSLSTFVGATEKSLGWSQHDNYLHYDDDVAITSYGESNNNGVIGIALDLDNDTIEYFMNGVSQGVIDEYSIINLNPDDGLFYPTESLAVSGATTSVNFGATPFQYDIPYGFKPYDIDNAFNIKHFLKSNNRFFYIEDDSLQEAPISEPLTKEHFNTYGFNGLKNINPNILNELPDNYFSILTSK